MNDQVYMLKDGEEVPVEPAESLVDSGWVQGTWVRYASSAPVFSPGVIGVVERSDGEGVMCGFLIRGPQHKTPMQQLSDMWGADVLVPGGDKTADWTGSDPGGPFWLDNMKQLQRLGSRVVTMYVPPTGYFKWYTYERYDLVERTVPGTGAALAYVPNDKLYVSDRGLLTSEQEQPAHAWTGYVVARVSSDDEGDFLFVTAAVG